MNILASLARAYDRIPDAPPYGFSAEMISFCVVLRVDGSVANILDLRESGRARSSRRHWVPQALKRTRGIMPNFLWDRSGYVLGVTKEKGKRTAEEHSAFKQRHFEWLADSADDGLTALRAFLQSWSPKQFAPPIWPEAMRDSTLR